MIDSGYSESYAKSAHIKRTDAWQDLLEKHLPDSLLSEKHEELLRSTRLDHMVFPPAPSKKKEKGKKGEEEQGLTDTQITELLQSVNCTVRKIVHGDTVRHVYFWSADNKARKEALDMAYKLKKKYGALTIKHQFGELGDSELEGEISREISETLGSIQGEETPGD